MQVRVVTESALYNSKERSRQLTTHQPYLFMTLPISASYLLSRAKAEVDTRLILQHETFKKLLEGRLLNVPIPEPGGRVLDIGTGSGIWAAELAVMHPTIEVIGIDNFPQPM